MSVPARAGFAVAAVLMLGAAAGCKDGGRPSAVAAESSTPAVAAYSPPPTSAPPAVATTTAPVTHPPTTQAPTTRPPTHRPSPTPVRTTSAPKPAPPPTCGAPANPWGYNFCGRGSYITNPASAFCSYFNCIASFWQSTNGYVEECVDLTYSHSGGRSGSCSHHGGNYRPLYG